MLLSLVACTLFNNDANSSQNSSGSDGGGSAVTAAAINMGNITTIPTNSGSSGLSTLTITNNLDNKVTLKNSTYTITQNGASLAAQSTSSSGSPIDMSQCASIPARGTCSVSLSQPSGAAQSQYTINVEYFDSTANATYKASNLVAYSDSIPTTDTGVRYSTQNNNLYNQPNGSTTLTVPFQLMKSFSNLTVVSNNSNPTFAPTISCPGNNYTAGTLCNLYVKISNAGTSSVVAGGVTVNGEIASSGENGLQTNSGSKQASSSNLGGTSSYLFNVPITVTQNLAGNLITSAVNIIIDPSDGSSQQTVTLLNNGSAALTDIQVTGATPVVTSNNNCKNLDPYQQCTFDVNVTSETSGQSIVNVSYNNGSASGGSVGLLAFNVLYTSPSASPGLSLTSGQGNLNNIPVGTIQYYNILVNNTGNTTLKNIKFTDPSTEDASFQWSSGSCSTSGSQTLAAGESCTLTLKYSPTKVTSEASLNINAIADWNDQKGNLQTYAASTLGVTYSSISGDAFVYITPNYVGFAIKADGKDTVDQTFYVINAGLTSTKINSITVAPGVSGFHDLGGSCIAGQTILGVNESCTINTRFGATSSSMSNVESQINVGYKPNGSYQWDVEAFANLNFNASLAASVAVDNIVVSGASSGDGTSAATAYQYINTPLNPLSVKVTYKNSGSSAANKFNVALNNLPIGYAQSSSDNPCGTGTDTITLDAGQTCDVVFYAVDPNGLYNPYTLSGSGLTFNIPGYSYTDSASGVNNNPFPTWSSGHYDDGKINITASLFATVTTVSPVWNINNAPGTHNFTFSSPNNGTVITIPTDQLMGFTLGNNRTCTISSGSCTIAITNPANFTEGVESFSYYVTPAGIASPSASNSIVQKASFSLTYVKFQYIQAGVSSFCALDQLGMISCWGSGASGQLGTGSTNNALYATRVSTINTGNVVYKNLVGFNNNFCATDTDDNLYCWGSGGSGQIGNNSTQNASAPTKVQMPTDGVGTRVNFVSLSIGAATLCGIGGNGHVYCWGYNESGQAGVGTVGQNVLVPTQIKMADSTADKEFFIQVAMDYYNSGAVCAVARTGNVYCWGPGNNGELGNGVQTNAQPLASKINTDMLLVGERFTAVQPMGNGTCAITSAGNTYCWGYSNDGSGHNSYVPTLVSKANMQVAESFSSMVSSTNTMCAISNLGNSYCWVYGGNGQMGIGTTLNSYIPVQNNSQILSMASSYYINSTICEIDINHQVYCWGYNGYGSVGNADSSTSTNVTLPMPITMPSGHENEIFTQLAITGSSRTSCGLIQSGGVYCWGYGSEGQLGNGGTTSSSTPVQLMVY